MMIFVLDGWPAAVANAYKPGAGYIYKGGDAQEWTTTIITQMIRDLQSIGYDPMFEARVRWVSKQRGTTKISMVATRPMYRGVDLSVRVWIYTPRNIYRRDELNRVKYTKKGMPWRKAYRADMLGIEKGLLDALKSAGVIDDDFPVDHAEFRRQKSQPDDVAPRIIVEVTPYDRCDWIDPPAGTAPVVHADHALDSHGPRVAPTTPTKRRRRSAA